MKARKTNKTVWILSMALALTAGHDAHAKKKQAPGDSGVEEALKFKVGDESGNEIKAAKTEMLVMKSEKKALEQLKVLEKKYSGTRMEPEILLRLAELYMRRARTERFFEVHKSSDQILKVAPQLVSEASEKLEIRRAIEIYKRIQARFEGFRNMDIVIFNNAYAHQQIGEEKEAEALFAKLIEKFPRSPLVPDAYLASGEIAYGRRAFSTALEHFKAIRRYPQARVYPYGMYKAAWCFYNMQDAESGMKQLEDVVKFGRQVAEQKLDSKLDLRKEALNDLALFYTETRAAADAVGYFIAQAQDLEPAPYILRSVELYKRHSRFSDVELVLKDFLAKLPKSEAVPSVHEELVWNYVQLKQQGKAVAQLEAFDSYCDSVKPEWEKSLKEAAKNKAVSAEPKKEDKKIDPAGRPECQVKIAETSKKLGTKWHALWKKSGGNDGGKENQTLSATVEKAYRLYLKAADIKDADLPTVHFAYAELLFARGQFREASEHYATIEGYQAKGAKIDPKVAHDAAYGAIVGLERAVGEKEKWNDVDEKRFVTLSESYVKRFPKGEYNLDLRFKRAFIAYEKERYDEAATAFKKIGWSEPPAANGQMPAKVTKAQDLYLDILNIRKDYKGLKEAAQSLLLKGNDAGRTTQVEKIYREAYFSEIQQMEEKGNLEGAINAYKKFATENQSSELAPKAWWNASQLQFKVGDATGGANTCFQMHNLFPKSPNGKDCLYKAAQTFESMGRLDLASKVTLKLAQVEPDKADKWNMVSADFLALSDGKDKAMQMYMKLAETKKGAEQLALFEKTAELARESSDMKTLGQIEAKYSQLGIEPQASRLLVEQGEEALAKGDFEKAFNSMKKIIARDGLPAELLARARLVQARVLEDEYRRQSVKAKVERIGIVLAIKTEKLEKAQKAFQSAIKYAHAETSTKALKRLAEMYLDYSKTVRGIASNSSLNEADQKAFMAEIEQIAVPMEEKGIDTMNQAFETAKKGQLRDGQIADLQNEVNRLNMKTNTAPVVTVASPSPYLPKLSSNASNPKEVGL